MSEWDREQDVECVVCPDCAFTFSAEHVDVDGDGYSCPACFEAAVTAKRIVGQLIGPA